MPRPRPRPRSRGRAAGGRSVAILGGSFNPPHVAHLMAAYWTLATQDVQEVWLLPSYVHPFGKALAPFPDRVRMCRLAVRGVRGVAVCTVERELADDPLVGRTARTLEHLVARHPSTRFSLVVGADILPEADKWWRWDRVKELARIVVIGREGYPPVPGTPSLPAISSTEVRARIARGEDVSGLVPRAVRAFIEEKGLYR